jgi:hypothetical protein
VLFAIAIPTFLGVQGASNNQSVTHLPPAPIVLTQPIAGGSATPVLWPPASQPVDTTLTPVPDGVRMTIASRDQAEWAGLSVPELFQSMQLAATVAITAGSQSNSIGLACVTPARTEQLVFVIHSSGLWQVELLSSRGGSMIDSGVSSAVHATGSNALTIACGRDPAKSGNSLLQFEINRTPVANDVVKFSATEWIPAIQLCSCDGPVTGSFLHASYYGSTSLSS